MKISIVGASGKVARQIIHSSFLFNKNPELELILFSTHIDIVSGQVLDLQSMASLIDNEERIDPRYTITDKFSDLEQSDYIFICSGCFMPESKKERYREIDSSGRLAHTFASLDMMANISQNIKCHAPNSKVIVLTNQSDVMAEIVRNFLPRDNVLGFGGMLDESRFKHVLSTLINSQLTVDEHIKPSQIQADIVGYHNNDMVLLEQSLEVPDHVTDILIADSTLVEQAMDATKNYGREISKAQKDDRHPTLHGGASIGPGSACWSVISTFSGQRDELRASFNVSSRAANELFDTNGHCTHLSVPVKLTPGGICQLDSYPNCSNNELVQISTAVENMRSTLQIVEQNWPNASMAAL